MIPNFESNQPPRRYSIDTEYKFIELVLFSNLCIKPYRLFRNIDLKLQIEFLAYTALLREKNIFYTHHCMQHKFY